jgi:nuclear pore complex protein Nup93
MEKQIHANTRIASLGGQPGILNKVRGYTAIQLAARDAESKYHAEKVNGVPLYMYVWYLLRSGHSAEAIDMLADNQQNVKREDSALPGALKSYFAAPDRRLGRGQRDQLMNDFNTHIRGNPTVDVFKAALYKLIGRFDMARKTFKVAADTTEDWVWGNLMLVREAGSADEGPSEKYDLADFGKFVQDYGSATFDAGGAKWATWVNMLLCAGEFESVNHLTASSIRQHA